MARLSSMGSFLAAAVLAQSHAAFAQTTTNGTPATPASPQASTTAAVPDKDAARPEVTLLQALLANPMTAPYRFAVTRKGNMLILSGRVGTKMIHDAAIRTAIALGYPVRDDLTIDTAEAHRVAALSAGQVGAMPVTRAALGMPPLGAMPSSLGTLPYVYPQPLFGRIDDPFYGMEPPLLSYPPWWGALVARSGAALPATSNLAPAVPAASNPAPATAPLTNQAPGTAAAAAPATAPQDGVVEMTLDPRGVAVLRGTVPTLADRIAIGQQIAQSPGITEVLNLLDVAKVAATSETPPPPPQPAQVGPTVLTPVAPSPEPAQGAGPAPRRPGLAVDAGPFDQRITEAIAHRPSLANLPIKVVFRDGIATVSGSVPTVYEAMLAFRAVQQTPGVRDVVDRLEFVVPDGEKKNPLLEKGRPEDVEGYLTAQIRRQVGDVAHIDQVRLRGDTLEIRGTLVRADDRARLEAILRSMPVLRGFRLEPTFVVD
jgi:hypothetical protein